MNIRKLAQSNTTLVVLFLLTAFAAFFFPTAVGPLVAILLAVAWHQTPSTHLCTIAGAGSTQTRFVEKPCTVVVSNNFDTHGTVTRASVEHMTPQDVWDLFKPGGLFADMEAWFWTAFEMKACGTKINCMYDWLRSSEEDVGNLLSADSKLQSGPSLLFPFIMGRQDSVINNDFWYVSTGFTLAAYTPDGVTGPLTTADKATGSASNNPPDRIIRVGTRYGVDLDAKYFTPRARIYHFNRMANGASYQGQWKVLASAAEAVANPTYVDLVIRSESTGSTNPYDMTPTSGIVLIGPNNVADWESYCQNRVTVDPRRHVPFWYQTMRRARRVDSEYKVVYQRLMQGNAYFREFGDLPLSVRNAQDEMLWQKEYVNAFFFGQPISSNQTLANWKSLEAIESVTGGSLDAGQGGKLMARRANMIGVKEQLIRCGQYRDLQNTALNFYEWLNMNYTLMRARKSWKSQVQSIDWFTNQPYSARLQSAFFDYYQNEYADSVRVVVDEGVTEMGFAWTSWTVKFPAGIKINLVTHEFFDDFRDAFNRESMVSAGNLLLALELGKGGSIYPGRVASNRVQRTLGQLNQLATLDATYACTMALPSEDISLTSETATCIVSCPANNLWVDGAKDADPVTTGVSGSTTSQYTDLY